MTDQETPEVTEAETPDVAEPPAEPQQDTPPEPPARTWDDETEADARLFGWKSPDEWQGDKPDGYIADAGEFMERVKRSRIFKTMSDQLDQQTRSHEDMTRRLTAMQDRALQDQEQRHQQAIQNIAAAQRQAMQDGDTERYDALEGRRQELARTPPQTQPDGPDPVVQEYMASEAGQWTKNPVLLGQAKSMIDANPSVLQMSPQKQLEFAEAEMRKMYPAYFPSPEPEPKRQNGAAKVDAGGLAGGSAKTTAFSKLPSDAKAQFSKFVSQGIYENTKKDQEEYANEYNAA